MPIDINNLRTYRGGEPEKWRKYMADRFKDPAIVDQVIAADDKWRETTKLIDHMRRDVNKLIAAVHSESNCFKRLRCGCV